MAEARFALFYLLETKDFNEMILCTDWPPSEHVRTRLLETPVLG